MKLEIRHKTVKRRVNWYDPIYSFDDVNRFREMYGDSYTYRVYIMSKANQTNETSGINNQLIKNKNIYE